MRAPARCRPAQAPLRARAWESRVYCGVGPPTNQPPFCPHVRAGSGRFGLPDGALERADRRRRSCRRPLAIQQRR